MSEIETLGVTRRERAYLIDGLIVLMHQMVLVKENDLSELPEMQRLLDRLMAPRPSSSSLSSAGDSGDQSLVRAAHLLPSRGSPTAIT